MAANPVAFQIACVKCNRYVDMLLDAADIKKYEDGALIQEAFPHLSKDAREMLISGICNVCWDKLLPPEEDEDA